MITQIATFPADDDLVLSKLGQREVYSDKQVSKLANFVIQLVPGRTGKLTTYFLKQKVSLQPLSDTSEK